MAYIIDSAIDLRHNLEYEFEGGDRNKTVENLVADGIPLHGSRLGTCFMFAVRVPNELLGAVPERIVVTPCKDGFIPDFGYAAEFGCYIVSDRFVDVVERLEPGVHQFVKIAEAVDNKGKALERSFHLANILTRLSAIDVERSNVYWHETDGGSRYLKFRPGPGKDQKLTLRKAIIDGHHLWEGSRAQFATLTFCSERLREEITAAGLSQMRFRACNEI